MHSEAAELFRHFWWLIFPVLGMSMGFMRMFLRHARSNRAIDVIKAYVDQGKEPPPELLVALRQVDTGCYGRNRGAGLWIPFGVFLAMTAGFIMLALHEPGDPLKLYFAAMVMGGLCVGFLLAALTSRGRDKGPTP